MPEEYEQGIVTSVEESPMGDELVADAPQTVRTNLDTDPQALLAANWLIQSGTGSTVTSTSLTGQTDGPPGITSYRRGVIATGPQTAGSSGPRRNFVLGATGVAGDVLRMGFWFWSSKLFNGIVYTRLRLGGINGSIPNDNTKPFTAQANAWTWIEGIITAAGPYDTTEFRFAPVADSYQQVGDVLKFTGSMVEIGPAVTLSGDYFDGDTPDTVGVDYAWNGTARASSSRQTTGASLLALTDAGDFDEDGGQATVTDQVTGVSDLVTYTAADLDADTLTLSAPLGHAYTAGAQVLVYPYAVDRRALVQIEDQGEGVDCRVPHTMYERFPLGSRDEDAGEWVTIGLDGAEWVVQDVLARDPVLDGSFIDPDTVPAPPGSDGQPPTSSPTPTVIGGIGAIFARWAAPDNADPLTYQVHISPTSGFTPDATTLVVESPATSITIRKLPTPVGSPASDVLRYEVPYYVRIVAVDEDGAAPVGAQGAGQMVQVNSPDIAANSVVAGHIVANQITGDLLAANVLLGSKITTGSMDAFGQITGQRVELDPNGLVVLSPAGVPIVTLPTDPGQAATFDGDILARGLTIRTAADIIAGATLTLASTGTDPVRAPTMAVEWESVTLQVVSRTDNTPQQGLGTFGIVATEVTCICESGTAGVFYVVQSRSADATHDAGTRVWTYNLTTGQNVQLGGVYFTDYADGNYTSAAFLAGKLYALRISPLGDAIIRDLTVAANWDNYYPRLNTGQAPALGQDGTNLIVAENDSGTQKVRTLGAFNYSGNIPAGQPAPSIPITATTVYGAGTDTGYPNNYAQKGAFDFGATKVVIGRRASGLSAYVMASATGSTRDASLEFPASTSNRRGMMWTGGFFYTYGGDNVLRKHSALTLADGLTQWWAAVTWRDTVGTLHETKPGPMSSVTMARRARLRVTTPAVATGTGGVDDPNAWALYMTKVASGTPATTALHYQTAQLATAPQYVVTDVAMAGAAPPTTNNFAGGGTPGLIQSQATRIDGAPKIKLDGSGAGNVDGLIPPGTMAPWGAAAAPAGWALCNGAAVSRTLNPYRDLFAAIGTRYGAGDGATTFNLPNSSQPFIQSRLDTVVVNNAAFGQTTIVFDVAFPGAPIVTACVATTTVWFAYLGNAPSATGFILGARNYSGSAITANLPVHWVAVYTYPGNMIIKL